MPDPSRQPHDPDERADHHHHQESARDERTGRSAAAARVEFQSQWVEQQLRIAMERGDFDDLPGAGKPIEDLGSVHDPDWWVKKLVEREQLSVLPPALALRKEDVELEQQLDRLLTEKEVRREVDEFNARVRRARMQLQGGPPVITPVRDPDAEVEAWVSRREARLEAQRAVLRAQQDAQPRRGQGRRLFGWRR
jgi:predicted RNase H-like nuclease